MLNTEPTGVIILHLKAARLVTLCLQAAIHQVQSLQLILFTVDLTLRQCSSILYYEYIVTLDYFVTDLKALSLPLWPVDSLVIFLWLDWYLGPPTLERWAGVFWFKCIQIPVLVLHLDWTWCSILTHSWTNPILPLTVRDEVNLPNFSPALVLAVLKRGKSWRRYDLR